MGLFSKKKNTYNTYDMGLDEEQFDALSAGQTTIGDSVQANFDQMQANAAAAQAAFEQAQVERDRALQAAAGAAAAAQADAAGKFDALTGQITTGFGDIGTTMAESFQYMDDQAKDQYTGLVGDYTTNNPMVGGALGQVRTDLQMDILDTQDQMSTGFDNLGTSVTDGFLNQTADANIRAAAAMDDRADKFDQLTTNLDDTRAGLQTLATDNQMANLEQQQLILQALENAGLQRTNYYEDLKADTTDAITRLGNQSATFGEFQNQYNDNTTLANQQRAQIRQAQAMNTNDLLTGQGANAAQQAAQNQAIQTAVQNANNQLGQIAGTTDEFGNAITGQTADFASIAQQISSGFDATSEEDQAMRNEFVDRLSTVREILTDQNANIDNEFRQTYGTMVDSFDETGALIRQSALANGDYISRAIDDQGRLILSQFNNNGALANQTALNLNQLMARMDELGYIPGSNVAMAGPTGSAMTYSGGQANPFSGTIN